MEEYFNYYQFMLCAICLTTLSQIPVDASPVHYYINGTLNKPLHVYVNGSEVTPSPGSTDTPSYNGVRCTTDKECPINQCCVHNPLSRPPPKKRFIFEELTTHDHGYCRNERKLNETCFPFGHDVLNAQLYDFHCPCVSGLECRGQTVHETQHEIKHINPRCQELES